MTNRRTSLFSLFLVALLQTTCSASELWPHEVCQPFNVANGIAISSVSYLTYGGAEGALALTCSPSRIGSPGPRGESAQNAAFLAGLKVSRETGWGTDTLSVVLDASRYSTRRLWSGSRDSTLLIQATVECLKANAGRFEAVHFLKLQISGGSVYRRFSGVFPLSEYRCGPRVRQF